MVLFYDLDTKEIRYTERDTMQPELPIGPTIEKAKMLSEENLGFVSVPYEMDIEVFNYLVCFDSNGRFQGLQPKEGLR